MIHFCAVFPLVRIPNKLNLSHTASWFRIVAMFVIVDMKAVFNTEFAGMFMSPYHEDRLQSLWAHFIIPIRNVVEVR